MVSPTYRTIGKDNWTVVSRYQKRGTGRREKVGQQNDKPQGVRSNTEGDYSFQ